ncbi:hypothetical protein K438DRAFT_751696 [Mycena galopus ATCC 62051]|nr:hypothetical protein K438DRAFT_751696 [Mycena galopus ATCC 62051]
MLYHFREAQEPELGFGTRADRQPRCSAWPAHARARGGGRAAERDFAEGPQDSGWQLILHFVFELHLPWLWRRCVASSFSLILLLSPFSFILSAPPSFHLCA